MATPPPLPQSKSSPPPLPKAPIAPPPIPQSAVTQKAAPQSPVTQVEIKLSSGYVAFMIIAAIAVFVAIGYFTTHN
jgi:hypothetical protein